MRATLPADYVYGLLLAAAAALLIAWQVQLVGDWRVDDAYITFAFAKNLATGRGLTFGYDLRVEGYTNFLWTVLNAGPIAIWPDKDPLIAARVMAFGCLALQLWGTYKLTRMFGGRVAAAISVLLLAAWTDLTRAVLSGLETVPHAMLITLGTLHYLKELPEQRKHSLWWFALAALMRISGMLTLALVIGFELCSSLLRGRFQLRSLARWAVPPLGLFAAYFAWRYSYYGLLFPTTYYAKTLVAVNEQDRGARYLWDALRDLGALPLLAFAAFKLARKIEAGAVFLFGMLLFEAVYIMHVGGDWMPFNRFLIPLGPPAVALFAAGMSELHRELGQTRFPGRALGAVVSASTVLWVGLHADSHSVTTPQEQSKLNRAEHERKHTNDNLLLNRGFFDAISRKPGEVLVTDYGGVFGYYTSASLIEMWGLCNREIALRGNASGINPVYGKTCVECYKEFDPDYFHIKTPIVRGEDAIKTHRETIDNVFQGWAIDRHISLVGRYATGRVRELKTKRALFFLEKRRPGYALVPRIGTGGLLVDYPFEPAGKWPPEPALGAADSAASETTRLAAARAR